MNKDLQKIYKLLTVEQDKVKSKIDRIDRIILDCDRLNAEYWCDVRAETVAFLSGIHKAADIVWKELHR